MLIALTGRRRTKRQDCLRFKKKREVENVSTLFAGRSGQKKILRKNRQDSFSLQGLVGQEVRAQHGGRHRSQLAEKPNSSEDNCEAPGLDKIGGGCLNDQSRLAQK